MGGGRHTAPQLSRDGGDASNADIVVAMPSGAIADALGKVRGRNGKVTIDTTTTTTTTAFGGRSEGASRSCTR